MKRGLWNIGIGLLFVCGVFFAGCSDGGGTEEEAPVAINIAAIGGVKAPVAGETPVSSITETAQYTGAVSWAGELNGGKFVAGTVYTATITLTAKSGYTLTGVAANFFTVAGTSSAATNPVNSGVITAAFPAATTPTVINIAAILGVTVPVAGEIPVMEITEADQYTGTVSWAEDLSDGKFVVGTVYTATITLTAKSGFTLQGVGANFFTVAGTSSAATNPANSGVIRAVFPATAEPAVIDIAAILGVTAPVTGGTPVLAITEADQYTGTVSWNTNPATFAPETAYTATITLTAKSGYTLTGVEANFFTVAGASATNPVNSGVIAAVFPATEASNEPLTDSPITILAIAGVTVPVAGNTPVTVIPETAQYTGAVSWIGNLDNGKFDYSTAYTATITLVAKPGFTLTGVAANTFTVTGANPVTHLVNSGTVTAVFPQTAAPAMIDIAAIPGVTAPVAGGTPVSAITETAQYTGAVSWIGNLDNGKFDYSTAYTATITLTAKSGYTLTGVAQNFFTVQGATSVANSANTGVVTATFPATE